MKDFEKSGLQGNKDALYAKGFTLIQQGRLQEARNSFLEAEEYFSDKENIKETILFLENIMLESGNDEFQVEINNLTSEFRSVKLIRKTFLENDKLANGLKTKSRTIRGYKGIRGNSGVFFNEIDQPTEGTDGFSGAMGFHLTVIL